MNAFDVSMLSTWNSQQLVKNSKLFKDEENICCDNLDQDFSVHISYSRWVDNPINSYSHLGP